MGSRGLGDFEFKQDTKLAAAEQKVSCVPDVYEINGLTLGSIIVLACDGLWDVMENEEVAKFISDRLRQQPDDDLGMIAAALIRKSLDLNSRDNVTVMIVH